jgi:maleate isomerase
VTRAPCRLAGPIGTRATLGLIVLRVDETVEHDFRRLCAGPGIALHVTRIHSGDDLTPETIATMEAALPRAAGLLPPAAAFDSVGYACTSGAALIGAGRAAELVRGAVRTRAVADPLSAALAALRALGARRIGLVSPYLESVAGPICAALEAAGLEVAAILSFGEQTEARVARIDPASIRDATLAIGGRPGLDAVFVSCTNLRALEVVDEAEASLALPVVTSNLALAWQMFGHAGARPASAPGQLFRCGPAGAPRA